MKKQLLSIAVLAVLASTSMAQTVIYDNGPIFDLPGAGLGGANVSSLHDGMGTYGAGHAVSSGFRVADDMVISAGTSWNIDSLIFFAYQTGSGNISTLTEVNLKIWNGIPDDPGSTVVFGDGVTNLLWTSDWSGTYRTGDFGSTTCDPATCNQRPIMRNALVIGTTLPAGTYWLDWQTNGSLASGPWAAPVNLGVGITTTGNAKQFDPTAVVWNDLVDGTLTTEIQGLPFLVVGSVLTGLNNVDINNSVYVSPNPMSNNTVFNINVPVSTSGATLTVYDVLGNVVKKVNNITDKKYNFYRDNLNNGVYMYEITNGGEMLKKGKLVIE